MCRRIHRQTAYTYYPRHRRGCYSSRFQQRILAAATTAPALADPPTSTTEGYYYPSRPQTTAREISGAHTAPDTSASRYTKGSYASRHRCAHGGMAALLFAAIGLGAQKIREKREERRRKRGDMMGWEEGAGGGVEEWRNTFVGVVGEGKKREELAETERESLNGEKGEEEGGEVLPPRYEDIVRNEGYGVR